LETIVSPHETKGFKRMKLTKAPLIGVNEPHDSIHSTISGISITLFFQVALNHLSVNNTWIISY